MDIRKRIINDSIVSYPWSYYLLGGNGRQLAVYHGQETSATSSCGDAGRRVYMYPAEYLTYGIGATANLTTLPTHQKRYVIADHLGSARVVLDSAGNVVDRYDYDPFGTAMPLSGAVTGVRKSYIDRERDVESGLLNTGVRQLDGPRFTSVDPLMEKYPSFSPYVYTANNPINLIDPNGKELTFYKVDENGKYEVDVKGAKIVDNDFKHTFIMTLEYMEKHGVEDAKHLRYLLDTKGFTINVEKMVFYGGNKFRGESPTEGTLRWAPNGGLAYETTDENGTLVGQRLSPALGLIHEGDHAYRYFSEHEQFVQDSKISDPQYVVADERKAIEAEFRAGKILNHLEYIRPDWTGYTDMFNTITPWSNVPQK